MPPQGLPRRRMEGIGEGDEDGAEPRPGAGLLDVEGLRGMSRTPSGASIVLQRECQHAHGREVPPRWDTAASQADGGTGIRAGTRHRVTASRG